MSAGSRRGHCWRGPRIEERVVVADADSPVEGQILQNLLLFGRLLRRLGLDVHAGRMLDAVHVLEDIGLRRRARRAGDALRTLLVHRREHLPVFDEAFSVFWRQRKDQTFTMDLRSMGEKRRYRYVEAGPPPLGQPSDADGGRGTGQRGGRRPHRHHPHVQRSRGAAVEGLLGVHAVGDDAGAAAHGIAGVGPGHTALAAAGARERARAGPASDAPRQRTVRRRAAQAATSPSQGEAAQAGGHLRRERLHGALHADAAPLHALPLRRSQREGGGLPLRHAAHHGSPSSSSIGTSTRRWATSPRRCRTGRGAHA